MPADPHLAPEIIRIRPRRVLPLNIDPERPGPQTRNVLLDGGIAARDGGIAARDGGIAARDGGIAARDGGIAAR